MGELLRIVGVVGVVLFLVTVAPATESDRNERVLNEPSVEVLRDQLDMEMFELERQWGAELEQMGIELELNYDGCIPGYLSCPNPLGWVWWCDKFCNHCYRASC